MKVLPSKRAARDLSDIADHLVRVKPNAAQSVGAPIAATHVSRHRRWLVDGGSRRTSGAARSRSPAVKSFDCWCHLRSSEDRTSPKKGRDLREVAVPHDGYLVYYRVIERANLVAVVTIRHPRRARIASDA